MRIPADEMGPIINTFNPVEQEGLNEIVLAALSLLF